MMDVVVVVEIEVVHEETAVQRLNLKHAAPRRVSGPPDRIRPSTDVGCG